MADYVPDPRTTVLPGSPPLIATAPAGANSLPVQIGRVINAAAEGGLGFRFVPSAIPIRPGPAVILYAAPQAFGGVVPNSQYGLSDDYGIFTIVGGAFSESTRDEVRRANRLQSDALGLQAAQQALAVVQQLDNVDLVANLAFRLGHYNGSAAEYSVIEAEATEVIRRGLSGTQQVSIFPYRAVDIGATVATIPAPPASVASVRTNAGLPASFVGLSVIPTADGSISVQNVVAVRADVAENQRRQTALLQTLVAERVDP